jgi:hypothetical protein
MVYCVFICFVYVNGVFYRYVVILFLGIDVSHFLSLNKLDAKLVYNQTTKGYKKILHFINILYYLFYQYIKFKF